MSDLSSLDKSLTVLETQGFTSFGTANVVYISIPDNSSSTCGSLGLPTLIGGYQYHCSNESDYRKMDGTGWVPVNFLASQALSFPALPIDPVNATTSGRYYSYITGGSWELGASLESSKYNLGGSSPKTSNDGGVHTSLYEVGSNKTLLPFDYGLNLLSGSWAAWIINESSGQYVYDYSGNGRHMTLGATSDSESDDPAWETIDGVKTLTFDGVGTYTKVSITNSLPQPYSAIILLRPTAEDSSIGMRDSNNTLNASMYRNGASTYYLRFPSPAAYPASSPALNTWSLLSGVIDGENSKQRKNQLAWKTGNTGTTTPASIQNSVRLGRAHSSGYFWIGQIGALLIYPRTLTDSEFDTIYDQIKTIKSAPLP